MRQRKLLKTLANPEFLGPRDISPQKGKLLHRASSREYFTLFFQFRIAWFIYGLMTDRQGRPIAVDAYRGNTGDPTTVVDQVNKLRERSMGMIAMARKDCPSSVSVVASGVGRRSRHADPAAD